MDINLKYPVKDQTGKPVMALNLRRPKADDFLFIEKFDSELLKNVNLLARLASVDTYVIRELDVADFQAVNDAAAEMQNPT